jgi:hypothetical protein
VALPHERPVGCGTAVAGPPLNAGRWSAWAVAAGEEPAFVAGRWRGCGRGTKGAPFWAGPSGHLRARDAGASSSPSAHEAYAYHLMEEKTYAGPNPTPAT